MGLQRQRQAPVILDHMRAERHRRQSGVGLRLARGRRGGEQRQIVLVADPVEAAHRPQRLRGGRGRASGTRRRRRAAPARRARGRCAARDRARNRKPAPRRSTSLRMSSSLTPTICRRPSRTAWVARICAAIAAWRGWIPSPRSPAGEGGARARMRARRGQAPFRSARLRRAPLIRRLRPPPSPARGEGEAASSVQSQSDRFTSTSRTSTPCSRASRTSCAGA